MEKETEAEKKCFKLAQEIDRYAEEKDGCYWGHILDVVERAYKFGKEQERERVLKLLDEFEVNKVDYTTSRRREISNILNKLREIIK